MELEKVIGARIAALREGKMTQAELGERVGRYLGKPWSRQTVSAAEKGRRAFAALDLLVLSIELDVPLYSLFEPMPSEEGEEDSEIETPGGVPIPVEQLLPDRGETGAQQEQFKVAQSLLSEAGVIIAAGTPAHGFIGRLLSSGILTVDQGVVVSNIWTAVNRKGEVEE